MPRITADWLSAPPAGVRAQDYPGQALGLPREGVGSLATMRDRFAAFALDAVLSWLVAALFVGPRTGWYSTLVFLVEYAFLVGVSGQSAGMKLYGLRVLRLTGRSVGWWAVPRAVMIGLLVPVLFTDRDGRGVHDRATGTAVVRLKP